MKERLAWAALLIVCVLGVLWVYGENPNKVVYKQPEAPRQLARK
jgi:hypothetical protein